MLNKNNAMHETQRQIASRSLCCRIQTEGKTFISGHRVC